MKKRKLIFCGWQRADSRLGSFKFGVRLPAGKAGSSLIPHLGNTGAKEGKDCGLNGPENNDQQDTELHHRKGPELHRTKGNGGEDDEKNENEFYKKIKHGH